SNEISSLDGAAIILTRMRRALLLALAAWLSFAPHPRAQAARSLQIHFVDVEGGQATLFVLPSGESLLVDTGFPGNNGRDADRIRAAAAGAGRGENEKLGGTDY